MSVQTESLQESDANPIRSDSPPTADEDGRTASVTKPKRVRPKRRRLRKRTVALKRITRLQLRAFDDELDKLGEPLDIERPKTRADCANVPRPCPFVGCKYTAYLEVNPESGNITFVYPELEPHEMPADASCTLDVAERGGLTLEEVGKYTNLTRERIRQLEVMGHFAMQRGLKAIGVERGAVAGEPIRDTEINMELAFG